MDRLLDDRAPWPYPSREKTTEGTVVCMKPALGWGLRVVTALVLLALGVLSLPLTALVFDEAGQEGWIIPVQIVVMALIGAGVGLIVPSLAGVGASKARSAVVGAAVALVGVAISLVLFFVLLNGIDGL